MLKQVLAALALWGAATAACAAVEVNTATAADLDSVRGIGPGLSGRILDARQQGGFKDWADLIARVKGLGHKSAARLSAEGMTVNGAAYPGSRLPLPLGEGGGEGSGR